MINYKIKSIAIIGQGYVGLPLAIELAKFYPVTGFDINENRVVELSKGNDYTLEANLEDLKSVLDSQIKTNFKIGYKASSTIEDIRNVNTYILTVPTPIDEFKSPDLEPLRKATKMIGKILKKGDFVIYESTVYQDVQKKFVFQS